MLSCRLMEVMAKVQYETTNADHENNTIIMNSLSESFTHMYSNSPAVTNWLGFICCFCELKVSVLWIVLMLKDAHRPVCFSTSSSVACDGTAAAPECSRRTHWSPHTYIMPYSISFIVSVTCTLFNLHAISNILRCAVLWVPCKWR